MPSALLNSLVLLRPHGSAGRSLVSAPAFGADVSSLSELPSTDAAKRMVADEINSMSAQEREEILEGLHGVNDAFREDPEVVSELVEETKARLADMERESDASGCGQYLEAYRLAVKRDAQHVLSQRNLLMFLRAVKYDPAAAALKLASHYTEKYRLFGEDLIAKELDLADMGDDEVSVAKSGCLFVPSFRDRSGRIVIMVQPHKRPHDATPKSLKRAYWCMMMNALRDQLTQFFGVVCVMLHPGGDKYALMNQLRLLEGTEQFVPYRCHGAHYCMEESACLAVVPLVQFFMNHTCRTRLRPYVASMDEHYKRLATFGIVLTKFKLPELVERHMIENVTEIELHRLMSQQRQRIMLKQAEEERQAITNNYASLKRAPPADKPSKPPEFITVLNENDVLWGRGKAKKSTGNLRMQEIVKELRPRYSQGNRHEKTLLVNEVMERVRKAGGRFLRLANDTMMGGNGWVVQSESLAKEKIGRHFRE